MLFRSQLEGYLVLHKVCNIILMLHVCDVSGSSVCTLWASDSPEPCPWAMLQVEETSELEPGLLAD